jgi:replicative DNA helicase
VTLEPTMPASIDAERSILGAILLDNAAFPEAAATVKPADFYLDSHRRLFTRICELREDGRAVDSITLIDELQRRREVEAVGGQAYIAGLTDGLPRRPSIAQYTRIVRGKAQLRSLILLCRSTEAQALEQTYEPDEILEETHSKLINLISSSAGDGAQFIREFSADTWKQLEARRERVGDVLGYSYGINGLDQRTGGIQHGDLAEFVLIGAKTSDGKTVVATQCAHRNAEQGVKVGIFSTEMSRHQVLRRIWTQKLAEAGVLRASWKMRDERRLSADELEILKRVKGWADNLPIKVYDLSPLDIREFDAQARLMIQRDGLQLVILDHVHEMEAWGTQGLRERFIRVAEGIRAFKRQTQVPVVGLGQFPKPADRKGNQNKRPTKHDFAETEALAQKADNCILIYRELDDQGLPTGNDEMIIAKGRDSGVSIAPVWFNKNGMCFEDREVTQ